MVAQFTRIALLVVVSVGFVVPAQADWLTNLVDGTKAFCHSVARDTKRRNCWPEPFEAPDRYAVRSPFATMVENGWERQNLINDYHFVDQGGELTEAARLKVQWILSEAPAQHRTIYVQRAINAEVTATRVDNVQQLAAQLTPEGALPLVLETNVSAQGWPAARADQIGRMFEASSPEPRLPEMSGGGETQ